MKNTKAVFFIILGSFIIATGFAFAVESETYNDLVKNGAWGTRSGTEQLVNAAPTGASSNSAPVSDPTPATQVQPPPPAPGAPAAAPAAKPEEKPTFGENMKKFLGKHMATMAMVGIGAYVGFALMGPAGILMGALFMYAFTYLGNL
ncbi:MAG: hypothetical protein A2049_13060 [Elusimicrobia bacterium GWA2_62_23]|nr:MAG: hypothetical protein A2049_13060 [Elusimicrobia bacterium GWA2_62_23]